MILPIMCAFFMFQTILNGLQVFFLRHYIFFFKLIILTAGGTPHPHPPAAHEKFYENNEFLFGTLPLRKVLIRTIQCQILINRRFRTLKFLSQTANSEGWTSPSNDFFHQLRRFGQQTLARFFYGAP